MCEEEMKKKGSDQSRERHVVRRVTNQRSADGDDTGSDDDRMVICENQEDSSQCIYISFSVLQFFFVLNKRHSCRI